MRCQKCGKLLDDTMSVCPICNAKVQQKTNYTTAANQYNNNSFVQQNDTPQRQKYAAANNQQPYQHQQVNTPNSNWNPPPTANQNQQMQSDGTNSTTTQSIDKPRSMGATVLDFSLRIALILGILIYEIIAGLSTVSVSISIVILTMLITSMVYSIRKKQNNCNKQGISVSQNRTNREKKATGSLSVIVLDYGLRILLILGILIYDIVANASTVSISISVVILTLLILSMVYSVKEKLKKSK